jgi:SAM-dependent methyltransferase
MPDNSYDVSFCMMVLEHVSDPKKAVSELARVTKQGGVIYLSTNFMYPRHGKPQDYFRFTEEGLRALASSANLKIESILPMGGYFSMHSQFLYEAPQYLRNKIILGDLYPNRDLKFNISRLPLVIVCALPVVLLNLVFQVMAIAVQSLDILDKTKIFTMGYIVTLRK